MAEAACRPFLAGQDRWCYNSGRFHTSIGGAVGVSNIDQDGLEDRAYRLHYNQGQNRTDVFAQAGAVAGLAAGAALLRGAANASALHYLGCSSAGAASGILLHVLTRPKEE
ncbi:hypothetical protein COO60DRAFT_1041021 [Scenedesmus sp. NREL 46B-D3]|nr:hypothetical protein COO60DRAFT_1041021 [Scenedesmus sp. NREL 46B-D3]